jgi:hypothetical protein
MGNRGLRHLRQQNRNPITQGYAAAQHQVRDLIRQPADVREGVLEAVARRRLMDQRDTAGLMRPLVAHIHADVVVLGYVP